MKPLHMELKDIREGKKLSLEEIYRETKIRIPFLEKIEEGDFSVVPEPFMRAFLKEYAEAVGIDPVRVIAKYEGKSTEDLVEEVKKHENVKTVECAPPPPSGIVTPPPNRPVESIPERPKDPGAGTAVSPPLSAEQPLSPSPSPAIIPVISDEPGCLPVAENAPRRGPVLPDEEEAPSSRTLLFGIFAGIVIVATLVILYLNGIIAF